MRAYKQGVTKSEFVKELKVHQKADAFIRGTYGDDTNKDFKGCAVGCSLKSIGTIKGFKSISTSSHSLYEKHLGIPEWLARVEDALFEGMSVSRSKTWPVEFAQAIGTGANLEKAKTPFLIAICKSALKSVPATDTRPSVGQSRKAVLGVIVALRSGNKKRIEEASRNAYAAAAAAAYSAYSASSANAAAAYSSYAYAYAAAAASAADAAAYSSYAYAAAAAYSAADAAAHAATSASYAARTETYENLADELLKILRKVSKK